MYSARYSARRSTARPIDGAGPDTGDVAQRLEQLEAMFAEERQARVALEDVVLTQHAAKLEDHGDGLHVLMDMLEGTTSIEAVEAQVQELRRDCEEAQQAQIEDMAALRQELAAEVAALAGGAELEERLAGTVANVEEQLEAKAARLAADAARASATTVQTELDERVKALDQRLEAHVVELQTKISDGSTDAAQRLQILDAKHESLEHTLGIRFDSRLMVVEDVVSSVESRINTELTGFEEKLDIEFARLEKLEGSMAKKISDSS